MQVRYGQLMKQQEKMIRDMEASVARREAIATRGEGRNKTDQKRITKSDFCRKKEELRKKIAESQKVSKQSSAARVDTASLCLIMSTSVCSAQVHGMAVRRSGLHRGQALGIHFK